MPTVTLLNEQWEPLSGVTIEMRDADTRELIDRQPTDIQGFATFTTPNTARYYYRPLVTRQSRKVNAAGGQLHLMQPIVESGFYLFTPGDSLGMLYNIDADTWADHGGSAGGTQVIYKSAKGFYLGTPATVLARTLDKGTSWDTVSVPPGDYVFSRPIAIGNGVIIWAALLNVSDGAFNLAQSVDNGSTWAVHYNHSDPNDTLVGLAPKRDDPNYIAAFFIDSSVSNTLRALVSTDGGGGWTEYDINGLAEGGPVVAGWLNERLIMASSTASNDGNIAYSDDFGATWTIAEGGDGDAHAVEIVIWDEVVYIGYDRWRAGTSMRVFRSANGAVYDDLLLFTPTANHQLHGLAMANDDLYALIGGDTALLLQVDSPSGSWAPVEKATPPDFGLVTTQVGILGVLSD